ncbi:BTAD domain-containing putative transcriptional regulator [Kutzneria kofuensis]|uniref:BTAD domain-containing putative transcriptional regulator n=1 Tax=Kutzneria kofuensis TaxID=103725 RepID=UPI0031E95250
MQIRVLGTVEAQVGDELVALGPRQRRLVLGVLAWEVNRLVPIDRLVSLVWPESPPRSASHAVRVAVSDLRTRLPVDIETHGTGYLLRCDPMLVDVHRFLALVAQARKTVDDRDRLAVLDEALGLWRGPVLADVAPDRTRDMLASGVEETRLVAVEDRADALLRLGGHRDVVEELLGLVDAHPTRERLVGQLMLALYRSGRASQALEVFRRTRAYLAEELGIDPGAELRRLELAILRNDEELDLPVVSTALVGRRHELAQLGEWRTQALSGRTTVVLVEGAAGIGKSTLLDEFGRGIRVLRGQGVAEEGAPAYWPWRQIFRQWLGETEPTVVTEVLGESADKIARIVPEIGRSAPVEPTAEERFALFDEVTAFVGRMAVGGLVIIVDDLHWADPASLLLFSHLARGVAGAPLLLIGAFRPYELRQAPRGGDTLAEITRLPGASRLELAGLSVDEVAQQLTTELGRPCDPYEAATVAQRTGGNPLFVREIGRLRRTDPKAPITEVPTGARDAIRQYLSVLSPSCRGLLTTASVLSAEIDPVSLAAVSGSSIEDTLNALDEAVAVSAVLPSFRFAHDLVRDSLMLDLTPTDRARIHLRAAEHLETVHGHPAQIAHHRLAALPLGDPASAVRAASRAAEQALSQLAYEDAVRLYDQALAAHGRPDGDLLIGKATAQYLANDVEPARRTCERAADLARRNGDPVGLGQAALVMPEQADPLWLPTITPWCEQALADLPPEDSVLRAKLLSVLVVSQASAGKTDDAMCTSGAALAMAERLDDPATVIAALRARKHAHSGPDGVAVRLELGDRAVALAGRAGDSAAFWGQLWRYDALMQLGRVHDAELALDLLEPLAGRLNQLLAHWYVLLARAAILQGRGRFADALDRLDRASRLAERGDNPHGLAATEITRAYYSVLYTSHISDSATAILRRGFGSSVMARVTMATLCVAVEDLDQVREHYAALPPIEDLPIQEWYRLTLYGQYAQIAAAVGDPDTAAAAYERMLPYAGLHMTNGANVSLTGGSVHHYLGIAAMTCGRVDAAVDHFRSAVTSNAAAGLVPRVGEARYHLAVLLRERGKHAEALPQAKEANAIATRLGMPRLTARTVELLSAYA